MKPAIQAVFVLCALVLGTSCDSNEEPPMLPPNVRTWISGVTLTSLGVGEEPIVYPIPIAARFDPGTIPAESQGPPMLLSPGYQEVGTGETRVYDLTTYARDNLTKFYVWVGEGTGFWEITLPQSAGSIAYGVGMKITITFAENGPAGSFHIRTAGTDTLGKTGSIYDQRNVMFVSDTGVVVPDVSAVLSWAGGSDLDLHVIDPFGHDLSPFIPTTPEGGVLENGNGNCVSDTTSQERALWPKGKAPLGEYRVIAVYYSGCGEAMTVPFSVVLKSKGNEDQEVNGSFDGVATGSVLDTVATFTIR